MIHVSVSLEDFVDIPREGNQSFKRNLLTPKEPYQRDPQKRPTNETYLLRLIHLSTSREDFVDMPRATLLHFLESNLPKENYRRKRDLLNRPTKETYSRSLQKRPTKRDLQKRPTKETYKRDLQKRPIKRPIKVTC